MRLGAARFVAGETLDQAVVDAPPPERGRACARTRRSSASTSTTEAEAESRRPRPTRRCSAGSRRSSSRRTSRSSSRTSACVVDEELAFRNVERLVAEAARLGNFIRIDMEDSPLVDVTLRIYRRLREAGHDNVGTVLQAYLYRSEDDLESLLPLKPNLRIVKGAYKEPAERRVPEEGGRRHRVRAARRALDRRGRVHRGRHARREADRARALARRRARADRAPDALRRATAAPARPRRAAATACSSRRPYGPDWYPYLMRRLAERPANLLFFAEERDPRLSELSGP